MKPRYLGVVALAGACTVGAPRIDETKLDPFLRDFANKIGTVTGIGCPTLPAELGAKAECTVDFSEGPSRKVVVTVDDATTGHVTVMPVESLVDREVLGQQIADFGKTKGIAFGKLDCPGNQTQAVGATFTCHIDSAGTKLLVEVTGKGTSVDWRINRRLLDTTPTEGELATWAKGELGVEVEVECGTGTVFAADDNTVRCTATPAGQAARQIRVEIDAAGKLSGGWAE